MKMTTGILSLSVALLTACGGNSGNNVTAPTLDTTTTASVATAAAQPAEPETAPALAPGYAVYNLKSPVKKIKEWSVSSEEAANLPAYDFSKEKDVEKAVENGDLEEMTTSIIEYKFTPEGKPECSNYEGNRLVQIGFYDIPGVFFVEFKDGLPVKFTLDEETLKEIICLDAFNKGYEYFTLTYGPDNIPTALTGKTLPFFSSRDYKETYSNYKFDTMGNWIRRTVKSKYQTLIQYRSYEY